MEVILFEKIDRLGGIGDQVNVKAGFARNYLLPLIRWVAVSAQPARRR